MCKDGKCGISSDPDDVEMSPEEIEKFSTNWELNPEDESELNVLARTLIERATTLGVPVIIGFTTKMEVTESDNTNWTDSLSASLPGRRASKRLRKAVSLIKGESIAVPVELRHLLSMLSD